MFERLLELWVTIALNSGGFLLRHSQVMAIGKFFIKGVVVWTPR